MPMAGTPRSQCSPPGASCYRRRVIPGREKKIALPLVAGVLLHGVAIAFPDIGFVRYGVGLIAGLLLAYGCGELLDAKGYPRILGLPGFALSIVWIWVAYLVPDPRVPRAPPRAQLPPRPSDDNAEADVADA